MSFIELDTFEEKNSITLLWEELKIFLQDDDDFKILKIQDDIIEIKSLNLMAFRKEYVYCKILSNIIPLNCRLELNSYFYKAPNPEEDTLIFNLKVSAENHLHYKGRIKIIK